MGGGLMQLVAYGAQDIYLTGNPQITFFKIIYRRHTSFSMESIEQTFNGTPDFGKKVAVTVSRNGDLVHRMYMQVELPSVTVPAGTSFRWLNWLGHILLKNSEIEIGGQRIDKHYGKWLHIWNELSQTQGHKEGYAKMVGNTPDLTKVYKAVGSAVTVPGKTLYIPLQFWFCRNPGLALPLISLQYHEVKVSIEMAEKEQCYWSSGSVNFNSGLDASLYVDYIYLDTEERRRFAQVSHEYLIEQVQFTGEESVNGLTPKIKLNFNHPCKELIWVVQRDDYFDKTAMNSRKGLQPFNFSDLPDTTYAELETFPEFSADDGNSATFNAVTLPLMQAGKNPVSLCKLQLNGHDRFSEREGDYFNLVQPYQHHENVPSTGINVYSFGLRPEEHQPSGTCNMSRIDNATLQLNITNSTYNNDHSAKAAIFAVNYNVFRVMSGMGGLAYSN
jgi:hypothetical protein